MKDSRAKVPFIFKYVSPYLVESLVTKIKKTKICLNITQMILNNIS